MVRYRGGTPGALVGICGPATWGVVSSATIAIGWAQCGHGRSAAWAAGRAAVVVVRVRGRAAGRSGRVRRRQASVLQAELQVARVRLVGIGVWQIGQGRVGSDTGGHRLAQRGGVAGVGA